MAEELKIIDIGVCSDTKKISNFDKIREIILNHDILNILETRNKILLVNNSYYKVMLPNNQYMLLSLEDKDIFNKEHNKRLTWAISGSGYVSNSIKGYLHRLILIRKNPRDKRINDPKYSVDHINQNKLDNRRENLRWATQSMQNHNRGKQERNKNAKKLPDGITQKMLPIYVYYCKECYNKEKEL